MKRFAIIFVNTLLCAYLLVGESVPAQASSPESQNKEQGTTNIYLPIVSSSLPTIIPATTKILGDTSSRDLTSISADGTVYSFSALTPELQDLKVGDIMIGEPSPEAPYGFIRKITTISSSGSQLSSASTGFQLIFTTISATLEQAFQQTSFQVDQSLPTQTMSINHVVLYDADGDLGTTNDQIVANGNIIFSPTLHLTLGIQDYHLQILNFSITGQETTSLDISSEVVLSQRKEYDFPPIVLGIVQTPVPGIVITPEITFYVGVEGNINTGVSTGITDTITRTVGVSYANGRWSNIDPPADNLFTYNPPTLSVGLDSKGYVGARLSFMVEGLLGPNAEVDTYLELKADPLANPWWTLYGGLDGKVGVNMDIFSLAIPNYEATLLNYQQVVAQAPATLPTYLYISSAGGIYVINTSDNQIDVTIPSGTFLQGITSNSNGSRVYSVDSSDNQVSVIDTATNTIQTNIPVGLGPVIPAISPDSNHLYITNFVGNSVSLIDTQTNSVTQTIDGIPTPWGIAVSPDGSQIAVTDYVDGYLYIISASSYEIITTVQVGSYPEGVIYSPDGTRIYVANLSSSTISVIDANTDLLLQTIQVGSQPGNNPVQLAFDSDATHLYVANDVSGTVDEINTTTESVDRNFQVGDGPRDVEVIGHTLYVTNSGSNSISIVDLTSGTVSGVISGIPSPHSITAVKP